MNKPILVLWIASVLAGCSFTPDWQRPEPPIPKQWPVSLPAEQGASAKLPTWRTLFTHPTVQGLIGEALANNRDLRMAVARMNKARALAGVAESNRWPGLQGAVSNQIARTPAELGTTNRATFTRRTDVGLSLPAFELDFWGRLESLQGAAESRYLASAEGIRAVRVLLIGEVVQTFITWRELVERGVLAKELVRNREEVRRLTERRVQVGTVAQRAFLEADNSVAAAQADVAELHRQEALALNGLLLLVGQEVKLPTVWPSLTELTLAATLPPGSPSQVLLLRPDVLLAELNLQAANADIGAARAAFFPRIALTSSVGVASRDLNNLFETSSRAWLFMPTISVPIFEIARRERELEAVKADYALLTANYEKTIQQAFREVADQLAARPAIQERLTAVKKGVESRQQRIKLVQARFQGGLDNKLELLDAEQGLQIAHQQTLTVQRQQLENQVALFKSMGGGADEE